MIKIHLRKYIFILFFSFIIPGNPGKAAEKVVNVFNWAGAIDPQILVDFEDETGIRVNYDVYDSAEAMEAKVMAGGRSGFDVVFVTAWPNLARQIPEGVYENLDREKLLFYKDLNKDVLSKLALADPGNAHAVPYVWGTTAFAYNKKRVAEFLKNPPVDSYAMLLDEDVVKVLSSCGIVLQDSPLEVFPMVLAYMGEDPNSPDPEILKEAAKLVMSIKPYLRKFQSIPTPQSLASGDVCVSQGWSGEMLRAKRLAENKEGESDIVYVSPKEGAFLTIDTIVIPRGAEHRDEAYAFINFLMRPDVIARVTNLLFLANAIESSKPFLKASIRNNPDIYVSKEKFAKLLVDKVQGPQYERLRSREWTRVKTGR